MLDIGELYRSSQDWLSDYVRSSFEISGRSNSPGEAEISAHRGLLMCTALSVANLDVLAAYVSPGATWREPVGFTHSNSLTDACSRTALRQSVDKLLVSANAGTISADELLLSFGRLRPFSSGNDLIGRALWMWRMAKGANHEFEKLRSTKQAPFPSRLHS